MLDRQRTCGGSSIDHSPPPEVRVDDNYGVFVLLCHFQGSTPVIAKLYPMIDREQSCDCKLEVFITAYHTQDVAFNGTVGCRIQMQPNTPPSLSATILCVRIISIAGVVILILSSTGS